MKRIRQAVYQTAAEIEKHIQKLESESKRLRADQDEHRQIMKEIAQLRIYADAKRWLAAPAKQRA